MADNMGLCAACYLPMLSMLSAKQHVLNDYCARARVFSFSFSFFSFSLCSLLCLSLIISLLWVSDDRHLSDVGLIVHWQPNCPHSDSRSLWNLSANWLLRKKKRGRPLGSKDGIRKPNAKRRGRPPSSWCWGFSEEVVPRNNNGIILPDLPCASIFFKLIWCSFYRCRSSWSWIWSHWWMTMVMMWELDIIEQRHQNAGMHLYSFSFLLIINWPFHFT